MAPRQRKSVRKTRKVAKATEKTNKTTHPAAPVDKCNMKHLCEYMEELNAYLQKFSAEYNKVRLAVCDLDRQLFGNGVANPRLFCTGQGAVEPAEPPVAPVW
jgi:hypothetical protein